MKSFVNYLLHPSKIREYIFYKKMNGKYGKKLSDKDFISKKYNHKFGSVLHLDNPQTFNEKLQWLKLYDRNPFYIDLCDKIKVKEIIAKEFGAQYVIPTIDVWDKPSDIDFDKLPNQFVLKCNHDSGSVIICKNKSLLDLEASKSKLLESLNKDYFSGSREWTYKGIEKKIFAEQYMESEDGSSLIDYKFFCFNGEPKFLYVSKGLENHDTACISFFDLNGNRMPFKRSDFEPVDTFTIPEKFEEMKTMAAKLAKFSTAKFIRVDLYSINGNIYFSEFTFFPCGGFIPFKPKKADLEIGSLLKL